MKPVVLFRASLAEQAELEAARRHLTVVERRADLEPGSLVVCRYSCLPYYRELEAEVAARQGRLVNTWKEHQFIADLTNWTKVLEGLTPRTWSSVGEVPDDVGPLVLKGETNSRKDRWLTHMFAKDKHEALAVRTRLAEDPLVGGQRVFVREFVPLRTFLLGAGGIPIGAEYRLFLFRGELLAGGYYWSHYLGELSRIGVRPDAEKDVPRRFLETVAALVKDHASFVVVDVAQRATGEWTVIELNDAQMSGLAGTDAEALYRRLRPAAEACCSALAGSSSSLTGDRKPTHSAT